MVQQSLALITASQAVGIGGGAGSALFVLKKARRNGQARTKDISPCYSGEEYADTPTSATTDTVTLELFYDAACTQPESLSQFTVTTSSTSASLTGSVTLYAQSGAVDGYDTLAASLTEASSSSYTFVITESDATSQSAAPYVNIGSGCTITQNGQTCSVAVDDHVAALAEDSAVVKNVSVSYTTTPSISENFSGSGSAYIGGLNSTKVSQQGASSFTVSGGSQVDTASLSASYGLTSSGATQNATLTIADSTNGGSISVTYDGSTGAFSGTLTQTSTGSTLATFSVDATGTGTVTYSDGSSDTIANGVISS